MDSIRSGRNARHFSRVRWYRDGNVSGALSDYITEEELEYVIAEFEFAGWNGGLNWYRVMDLNFHATPQLAGAQVTQPSMFIAGTADMVRVSPIFGSTCCILFRAHTHVNVRRASLSWAGGHDGRWG
jgi:hypothetical protein